MNVRLDGDRLEYECGRRGLKQAELAKIAGVHAMTVSRAKRGRVSEKTLTLLAVALARVPVLPVDLVAAGDG